MPHIASSKKKNAFNCLNTINNKHWLRHVSVEKGKIKHNDWYFFYKKIQIYNTKKKESNLKEE